MNGGRLHQLGVLVLSSACTMAIAGCSARPPFVLLEVDGPSAVVEDAVALRMRVDAGDWRDVDLKDRLSFPYEVLVVCEHACRDADAATVWVDALDRDAVPKGRGRDRIELRSSGSPTASVVLRRFCTEGSHCDDGLFCTGTETCLDGMCDEGPPPCESTFPCVGTECREEGDGTGLCIVSVNHDECGADSYCDLAQGCARGIPCADSTDCQNGYACDGVEVCVRGRCEAAPSLRLSDGDDCTLDGCDDRRAEQNLPPEYHELWSAWDGNICALDQDTRGICRASEGGCVLSTCGDGFVDGSLRGEQCDDGDERNTDDWALAIHCNADCSGLGPHCGDGVRQIGFEQCDDGDAFDNGNGCTPNCRRNDACGDRVTQTLFEECDDGNDGDPCDGCRDGCVIGCTCEPDTCGLGARCEQGECSVCDQADHCGAGCEPCSGTTPECVSVAAGCGCSVASCGPGWRCVGGECIPCDSEAACGPECLPCSGFTPTCRGWQMGCVTSACAGMPDATPCMQEEDIDSLWWICIGDSCEAPATCTWGECDPPGPTFVLSDTGQRSCSNEDGPVLCSQCDTYGVCGQDGNRGWDVAHDDTDRFSRTDSPQPVVYDGVTDLMWRGCQVGFSGPDCETGAGFETTSWIDAEAECSHSEWAGYHDWRLPTGHELLSVVNLGGGPRYYENGFPGLLVGDYWTSTRFLVFAKWVNFFWGTITQPTNAGPGWDAYVLCGRGPLSGHILRRPRYARNAPSAVRPDEYVVDDLVTGLMWQGCVEGLTGSGCDQGTLAPKTWVEALGACNDSDWAELGGWFLPNVQELFSIVQEAESGAEIDSSAFPGTPNADLWTSTPRSTGFSWAVDFWYGQTYFGSTGTALAVRCVRVSEP